MRLFVFGVGYSSQAFIEAAKDRFDWIGGTTRSSDKADALKAQGVEPFLFKDRQFTDACAEALASATHVLISIAPDEQGDPVLDAYGKTLKASKPEWIGYLSTVGVYGNHDGDWVDETTQCRPVSKRSRQRVAAETAWLDFAKETGSPVQIFRLSGIYGPGRNTFEKLRQGTARRLVKPGQVFNRIHVADIAGSLLASMTSPATRIINVTDDEPAPPQDVVTYAAEILQFSPPEIVAFDQADLTPMARSFYGENKRVANKRLRDELHYALQYPSFREGLSAILQAERAKEEK